MPVTERSRRARLASFIGAALQCPADLASADRRRVKPFLALRRFDWANLYGSEAWQHATQHLDDQSLRRVLEVVILAERDFRWSGGSVASGIWLYNLLCERRPAEQPEIADWVFRNRGENPWVPLGTTLYGARSWEEARRELRELETRRIARLVEGQRKQAAQMAAAAKRRERHRVAAAEHRTRSAAKNELRKAFLAGITAMPLVDRVHALLGWTLPLDAFPPDLLSDISDEYKHISRQTLTELRAAIGDRRGAWRQLAKAIDTALNPLSVQP